MMSRLRQLPRVLAALLLAALMIGHAGLALACADASASQSGGPCCCPMQGDSSPAGATHCAGLLAHGGQRCLIDCAAAQCDCWSPAAAVRASATAGRSLAAVPSLISILPAPRARTHFISPRIGPPLGTAGLSAGQRTYLDTLRLRI
jgi:hypothetical protein